MIVLVRFVAGLVFFIGAAFSYNYEYLLLMCVCIGLGAVCWGFLGVVGEILDNGIDFD